MPVTAKIVSPKDKTVNCGANHIILNELAGTISMTLKLNVSLFNSQMTIVETLPCFTET